MPDALSLTCLRAGAQNDIFETPELLEAEANDLRPFAFATASSEADEQGAQAAIDGWIGGYPNNPTHEWSSDGERAGAWLKLSFPTAYTVGSISLYDRPNPDE